MLAACAAGTKPHITRPTSGTTTNKEVLKNEKAIGSPVGALPVRRHDAHGIRGGVGGGNTGGNGECWWN